MIFRTIFSFNESAKREYCPEQRYRQTWSGGKKAQASTISVNVIHKFLQIKNMLRAKCKRKRASTLHMAKERCKVLCPLKNAWEKH